MDREISDLIWADADLSLHKMTWSHCLFLSYNYKIAPLTILCQFVCKLGWWLLTGGFWGNTFDLAWQPEFYMDNNPKQFTGEITGLDKHFLRRKIVNIFLPIIFSICFWCLNEPSH